MVVADTERGVTGAPPADVGDLRARCVALVVALGLGRAEEVGEVVPLTGGVASDIAAVELPGRTVCAKFALPKLKVAANWRLAPGPCTVAAPSTRGSPWRDGSCRVTYPRCLGWSDEPMGFAMERVAGPDVVLWKAELFAGRPGRGEAAAVGDVLGRVHATSARPGFDRGPFRNHDDFLALRLEPYLLFTAARHPALAAPLAALAEAHHRADRALVHGDVSPKNILIRPSGPVLLDAECATMGDPSFDVAFCLNHLVLKAIHVPTVAADRLSAAGDLWAAYRAHVNWEPPEALEARVAALLPALMLARVDGKSPVEYLTEAGRDVVRRRAVALVPAPPATVADLLSALSTLEP